MTRRSQRNWSASFSACLPKSALPIELILCSVVKKYQVLHPVKTVAKLQSISNRRRYVTNECVEKQLPISAVLPNKLAEKHIFFYQ